jgi:hypothetical protein
VKNKIITKILIPFFFWSPQLFVEIHESRRHERCYPLLIHLQYPAKLAFVGFAEGPKLPQLPVATFVVRLRPGPENLRRHSSTFRFRRRFYVVLLVYYCIGSRTFVARPPVIFGAVSAKYFSFFPREIRKRDVFLVLED